MFRGKSVYGFYSVVLQLRRGVASSGHRKSLGQESPGPETGKATLTYCLPHASGKPSFLR